MRTEHLKEFIKVAECGSLSAAARACYVTRPSLSSHISALEEELGFDLFVRGEGTKLTPEGSMFLEGVKSVVWDLERNVQSCRAFSDSLHASKEPRLRIACPGYSSAHLTSLAETIGMRLEKVPYDIFGSVFSAFNLNSADALIGYDYSFSGVLRREAETLSLASEHLCRYPCAIIARKGDALARKNDLSKSDLEGMRITVYGSGDFEYKWGLVADMFGTDNVNLVPIPPETPPCSSGTPHLIMSEIEKDSIAGSSNIVTIDKLDGAPFGFWLDLIYPSNHPEMQRIRLLAKRLRKQFGGVPEA